MSAGTATVRYFGGAKAAAGTRSELVAVRAGATVDGPIAASAGAHGEALARVLAAASFLAMRSPCTTARSTARVGRGYVGFTSVQPVDTSVSRPVLASVMSTVDLDPDYATRMWSWLMTVIPQTTLQDFSVVQSVSRTTAATPRELDAPELERLVEEVASGVLTGDTTAGVLERLERDAPHLSPVALRRVFVSFVWLIVFASLSVFCIEHADVMKDFNDLTGAAPFVVATAAASGTNRGWKALVPDSR